MIRRILFFIVTLVLAVSCFNDSVYSESYTLDASFEYDAAAGWNYTEVFGKDSVFFATGEVNFGFGWNALTFYHKVDDEEFKGGFALSYLVMPESGKTEGLENKFRVNAKSGFFGSKTYSVFCQTDDMPESDVVFGFKQYGTCIMNRCFVNNTVEVADSVKANFEPGDKLLLKAVGYLDNVETGRAEVVLAEFSADKDSIVNTWTDFDMSKLGSVDKVALEITSTKENVPTNVCIDNFIANVSLSY